MTARTRGRGSVASKQQLLNRSHLFAVAGSLEKGIVLLHISFQPNELSPCQLGMNLFYISLSAKIPIPVDGPHPHLLTQYVVAKLIPHEPKHWCRPHFIWRR